MGQSSRLLSLTSPFGAVSTDPATGLMVYDVRSPHLLSQAAGYLKYTVARSAQVAVYFRGQARLHPGLAPSLYRGISRQAGKGKIDKYLDERLNTMHLDGRVLRDVPAYAREPLLQHYGMRTRWLDVVDNVWVALWFACHEYHASGTFGEYVHYERRSTHAADGSRNTAFIVLVSVESNELLPGTPGKIRGGDTEIIDLRIAVPSYFVRPHAQHGLLLRRWRGSTHENMDLSDRVVGIIRVDIEAALNWLGDGVLLTVHGLFPPPSYDAGYQQLLAGGLVPSRRLGTIQHIGA